MVICGPQNFQMAPQKIWRGPNMALKITDLGTTPSLHGRMYNLPKLEAYIKNGTPNFNDGTPIIFKVESQGPPNILLGVKPCVHVQLKMLSINLQSFSYKSITGAQWLSAWLETEGPRVRASLLLFDLILYVPSTILQLNRDGSSWVELVLS